MRMRWMLAAVLAAAVGAAAADDVAQLPLGSALWRPSAGIRTSQAPGGGKKAVRADIYGLVLERATTVVISFRTSAVLGCLLCDGKLKDADGNPQLLETIAEGKPWRGELSAGAYFLFIGGEEQQDGAYLLSFTPPRAADAATEPVAPAATAGPMPFLGSWRLPHKPVAAALSPDGIWLATHDGTTAWLHRLDRRQSYRVPAEPGTVRRVVFSPDGWTLLVVSDGGARLLTVPELAGVARFAAQPVGGARPALLDAAFVGRDQRLVVLPQGGSAFLTSPIPHDLTVVPGGAAVGVEGAPAAEWFALRLDETAMSVIEAQTRKAFGTTRLTVPPRDWAVCPTEPAVAVAAAGGSRVWRAAPGTESRALPDLLAVAWAPDGRLVGSDGKHVLLVRETDQVPFEPAFAASRLAASSGEKPRLAALTTDGTVGLWELAAGPEPTTQEVNLAKARLAYATGLGSFKRAKYDDARKAFIVARELIAALPRDADADLPQVECLVWLRSSQASYMLKDWDASRREAARLVELAAKLPAGDERRFYTSMGLYREADALWEAGRTAEAKTWYQQALDAGLEGPAADDAKTKVK